MQICQEKVFHHPATEKMEREYKNIYVEGEGKQVKEGEEKE